MSDINFDYQLDPMSVVFDVGGYHGDFAKLIRDKYGCGVHVFEPVREHFSIIVEKFKNDPMIWPYNIALEDRNAEAQISLLDNSSSLYSESDKKEEIRIRDIIEFIGAFKLDRIDLLKMNCEGSEYPILSTLLENGWMPKVRNITVQFHATSWVRSKFEENLLLTHNRLHHCDHWQWYRIKS